ncbi:MAG: hypothetical protein ACI9E1_001139, partial [Cryomorphaceae bacterium]
QVNAGPVPQPGTTAAPILRKNITGLQAVRPAGNITGPLSVQPASAFGVNPATAPQPILSPDGRPSHSTSPVAIQPSTNQGSLPADTSPIASPDQGTAVIPVLGAQPKKPMSKTTLIVIGSMLLIALIIMCFVIFGKGKEKDHQDMYSLLIEGIESKKTLTVTKPELNNLLTSMVKPTIKDKIGGYTAMSKAVAKDGTFSPTLEIAKFITVPGQNIKDESMRQIYKAIYINPNHDPEADKLLLDYALKNPDKAFTADAINKMRKYANDSYIDSLLGIYDKTTMITTRQSCANTLTDIIKRSKSKSKIAADIITKYNGASFDEDKKLSYLRLLGTTGSKEALNILYQALKHDEIKFRLSAFKALSTSPTIEPFEPMLAVYRAETNELHLSKYRKDIFSLLKSNNNTSPQQRTDRWMKLLTASPNEMSRKHVIAELAGVESDFAGKLLEKIIASPDLENKIKEFAKQRLEKRANR